MMKKYSFAIFPLLVMLVAGCKSTEPELAEVDVSGSYQLLGHLSDISSVAAIVVYPENMSSMSPEEKFEVEVAAEGKIQLIADELRRELPFIKLHHIRALSEVVKQKNVGARNVIRCDGVLIITPHVVRRPPPREGKHKIESAISQSDLPQEQKLRILATAKFFSEHPRNNMDIYFTSSLYHIDRNGILELVCQAQSPEEIFIGHQREFIKPRFIGMKLFLPTRNICREKIANDLNLSLIMAYFQDKYGCRIFDVLPVLKDYQEYCLNIHGRNASNAAPIQITEVDIGYIAMLAALDLSIGEYDRAHSTFSYLYEFCPLERFKHGMAIAEFLSEVDYSKHRRRKSAEGAAKKISEK